MDNKVVFIFGAGASKEAGLPTGVELKKQISSMLDIRFDHRDQKSGDYVITQALRDLVKTEDGRRGDINPYLHQAWHIRDALPLAISISNIYFAQNSAVNFWVASIIFLFKLSTFSSNSCTL